MPLNLEGLVPDDDSVRLLSHKLEDLDYSLLYQAYSAKGRNPAVDPKTMFKILTYAYSQNIYSSRKIESACKRDINFMWLLTGQKAPDHSTIARFRTGFLADACANKYTFVWKKSVGKWEEKMFQKIQWLVQALKQGISANLFDFTRHKDTGFAGHTSVFERAMPNREYGFCSWAWKTEEQKSTVF